MENRKHIETMQEFHGVYPALITPFDKTGGVNGTVVKEIIDWHLDAGVNGFYTCGGTGEGLLDPKNWTSG